MENIEDDNEDIKATSAYINMLTKYSSYRKNKIVAGEFAFELSDTFGFPIDLTELMAKEKGWTVNRKEYDEFLQQQKNRSRAATAIDTE
ncbi:MAG: hypothetical protein JO072_06005, partial [Parafilimonas sp.]|nr:hypothetical protein [Parafilimonas sp.]